MSNLIKYKEPIKRVYSLDKMNIIKLFKSLKIKNKLEYLLLIPLTFSFILFHIFPFVFIYAIYDTFIQYNILYIIPLILYCLIAYCLITEEDSYLLNLVRKLVLNILFILYGISYINLLIVGPYYIYLIIQSFVT